MIQQLAMRAAVAVAMLAAGPSVLAEAPRSVAVAPAQARFVALDGAQNFRDIGGYRTASGRMVRHGVLYRSGTLGRLTSAGQAQFERLRTAAVVDLRTTDERSRDTNAVWLRARPGYWARDYGISKGDLNSAFGDRSKLSAPGVRAMMTHAYRTMAKEQTPSYRVLFARLLDTNRPVVLNCTAGKDRTGIGAALVLTALGVPYDAVRRDFLLSNAGIDPAVLQRHLSPPLNTLPAEIIAPLLGVEGPYLDAAFDQFRRDYGSVEGFMAKELGVGPREIVRLRRRMLR
ncbi:MAG: tyrosine-protein phosphatase [Novosphingobium sp.]